MKLRLTAAVLAVMIMIFSVPASAKENGVKMVSKVCPIMLPSGCDIALSAEYLEMRLGLPFGEIAAITITSLPKESGGRLMLDGVEVQNHETIFRSELNRLRYVQDEQGCGGWFSFIPMCVSEVGGNDSTKICATFRLDGSDSADRPVAGDVFCMTKPKTQVSVALEQDDRTVYTLLRRPLKGTVSIAGGECFYTPNAKANGADSFFLTAMDENGGVSSPIKVRIAIQK